jgi:ubiquinone/menaquinone biosynthesis C-methylase UbiE
MSSSATPDFARLAATYDAVRPVDDNWRAVYRIVAERLRVAARRVLDVGCGTGRLSFALARDGARVWGVDASPEMLAVAEASRPRHVEFRRAAAERLPFRDESFDVATFWLVIHLLDRPRAFAEARRVLRWDGTVAVVTFDESHFDHYWLNRWFPSLERVDRARFPTAEVLEGELYDAGFDDVELRRVSQRASLSRVEALHRLEHRHISTFDLLDAAEVTGGTERARRELPDRVEYPVEWLVAFADDRLI